MLAVPLPEVIDQTPSSVTSVKGGVVEFTQTEPAPPPIAATVGRALILSDLVAELVHPLPVTV